VNEIADKVRRICARLQDVSLESSLGRWYRSELKRAASQLAEQLKEWDKPSEPDTPQDLARQSYRSRETDSADGFAEGLKLFTPRTRDSEKKKD
jgi:hypothetical protein